MMQSGTPRHTDLQVVPMSAAAPQPRGTGVSLSLEPGTSASPPPDRRRPERARSSPKEPRFLRDYGAYMARLVVLGAAFAAGVTLNYLSAGHPYFVFVVLGGVLLICVALVAGPRAPQGFVRIAVPLFDLAWIMFAMYLTKGLQSILLPLMYIIVSVAAMRGDRWEVGTTLAGAITGIFVLANAQRAGAGLSLAAAQATLLAAGALAVRLIAAAEQGNEAEPTDPGTRDLYDALVQTTSDAVLNLDPTTWQIRDANPAALALLEPHNGLEGLLGQDLGQVLDFRDQAFLKACRKRLAAQEPVRGATTTGTTRDGRTLHLSVNLTPAGGEDLQFIQAVIGVTDEDPTVTGGGWAGTDFATHYIPSLTHELNNHLAAIRLSAELAATTGRTPDYVAMQNQVDHCQEVLQTVVMQMLRANAPGQTGAGSPTSNLKTVVEHALLLTRPQVLTSGIQLQLRLPEQALPRIRGYVYEVQESLVRIILHCVQAMHDREQPRTLTFGVHCRDEWVEITITDLSPGLKWQELAAINGHNVPVSRQEQRVWGLVREGITRFGGSLTASNGLNGGARFRITLPVAQNEGEGRSQP